MIRAAIRFVIDLIKLSLASAAMVALWALFFADELNRLSEGYARRNEFQQRLADAEREIADLQRERAALASGGFPAERALRELHRYGRPNETVLLLEFREEPPEDEDAADASSDARAGRLRTSGLARRAGEGE